MKKKVYLSIPIIAVALIIAISFYRSRDKYITATIVISDTILNITAGTSEKEMDILTKSITNEINRIDNILNPYNTYSEISKINADSLSGKTEIEISDEMAHIFTTGLLVLFGMAKTFQYAGITILGAGGLKLLRSRLPFLRRR